MYHIYSVPEGVLNGGVGATVAAATVASVFTGGSTRFSLFFDIAAIYSHDSVVPTDKL